MRPTFSSIRASRLLYGTGDFYTVTRLESLYQQLEQVLFELLGQSSFTLFFPNELENRLKPVYSTYPNGQGSEPWEFDLDSALLQSVQETYDSAGLLLTDDPAIVALWPFPARYCALLREESTLLGMLILHEGLDPAISEPFPVAEILEPLVRHFTCALMRIKSQEEYEKNLNEANARLLAINEIGELLGQLNLDILLSKTVSLTLQLIRAEVGNLMIFDQDRLQSRVEWGLSEEVVNGIAWRGGRRMVEGVFEDRLPILIEDLQGDARFAVAPSSRQIHSIVSLPLYTTRRDIGVLNVVNTKGGESFSSENMATLQTAAGLASTAIENAILHREAVEREVFQEQLRIARQIWENILPRTIPAFPNASISARSLPAIVVGGDFYDFIPLGEGRLGIVMADVSGKGIPAAMIMNMAKTLLHIEAARDKAPDQVLQIVNNQLVESTKMDSFVTLIYVLIEDAGRRAVITNAGHHPCLIYRHRSGRCEELPSGNLPLAIVADQVFDRREVNIEPGDCIVLYTDGVTEAMNPQREMFDTARLRQLLEATGEKESAEAIIEQIYADVKAFQAGAAQHDDTTVVVFKRDNP